MIKVIVFGLLVKTLRSREQYIAEESFAHTETFQDRERKKKPIIFLMFVSRFYGIPT